MSWPPYNVRGSGSSMDARAKTLDLAMEVKVEQEFEESLLLSWFVTGRNAPQIIDYVVEMALDLSPSSSSSSSPPKDAMVKRVEMERMTSGFIQNMPTGRRFFIAVVGIDRNRQPVCRSPWTKASTLKALDRADCMGNRDPMNIPRLSCKNCPCPQYSAFTFGLNSSPHMRCRRCGCESTAHVMVEVEAILKEREKQACQHLAKDSVKPLPPEALEWDTRECNLWFWTDGAFHPRTTVGQHRPQLPESETLGPGGLEGFSGRKGRVSVVTPTTQKRQKFHEALWKCFTAQSWPDKELVIIETYDDQPSEFFDNLAMMDERVVYYKMQLPPGKDWSIGLKRNIGAHLATGEFIANFDDDDLYAPKYLTSMVTLMEDQQTQAITLSSWFIYDAPAFKWAFCDPVAWGLANGLDMNSDDVKSKTYGYGFSYVFRRKAGLDVWYEDINFGEDFDFITHLQQKQGQKSVALFHDDFGICLHIQHGGNTSESITLRDVNEQEATNLDIMELAPKFMTGNSGTRWAGIPAGMLFQTTREPPSQRSRSVRVHTPEEEVKVVSCAVTATTVEFLELLEKQLPGACGMRVYRVPPAGTLSGADQEKAAIDVLGLAFLADMPGAEKHIKSEGTCRTQWKTLLAQAGNPMLRQERIGLRTTDLWVRAPEEGSDEVLSEDDGEAETFINVAVTCQKSTVKKFFSGRGAIQVRLKAKSTVREFRLALNPELPPGTKILAEKPGKGIVTLLDRDEIPENVTITDFKGRRAFYTLFTARQNRLANRMLIAHFKKPENQAKLDDIMSEAQNDDMKYRLMVCKALSDEVYPAILQRLNLPFDEQPLYTVMRAMQNMHADYESCFLWLESEVLMRNKPKMAEALCAVCNWTLDEKQSQKRAERLMALGLDYLGK